ncbi:flagellar assembly protein FliW [Desulfopila aestuarii]|uniref:Flagellar assembly factor FliW n=1 Tax=Desulfopila aestuarii DSM 18488 TaxID=1121416 RepID=A0A1M7YKP0_9BACT|nr:flagellar assembly protein FliW [Desulfopila aestuarii]SHO53138.1 flagellar assembly factor FliW [Desulfopila aestuarii DSM 18488]
MVPAEHDAAQPIMDSGKVITFPKGIPGFETYTKYTLFHKQENKTCVYWIESVDSPGVTFTLVDPTDYGLNYSMDLSDDEAVALGTDDPRELAVLLMLSKKGEDGKASSLHANIAGPIILNPEKRLGIQKVLASARLDVNIVQQ